jgi:NTE family protein
LIGRAIKRLRWTAAAVFFLLGITAVQKTIAQPAPAEPRPRIALVLSGGAAKGFAHVGVLKVLEEMRVPVHIITATSMGSIMGGLYASGLPPEEIEEIMATVDWNGLFRDAPPREDLDYRRKEDDARYLFDVGLGVRFNGEVILPRGVLVGQKIGLLFRRHTLHVSGIEDFDELPIPYRAVAADIETGEAYVIDHGDLAQAMRASMSIPGAFDPVEIEGHLLVDGGVADNMPVDLARALGADVVIAVDVSSPMRTREQLGNVFGIVGQLTSMLSRLNVEEQIPRADVLLDPELGELDGGDYTKAREFVATGEAVARRHAAELARYSVSEAEYAAYRERHRFKPTAPARVDFVEIVGNERVDRRVIESRMRIQPGGSLEPSHIEEDISAVYGLGDFTAVQWEVAERGDQQGIIIRVQEKPWAPNYLNFGMLFDEDGTFTGRINLTATRLNARGAELRNDIQLGSTLSLQTEFYQPLDFKGRFFVAPGFLLEDADQDVFDEDGREIAVYEVDRQLAVLDAGVQIGRLGELRLGVVRGKAGANVTVGAAELPDFDVDVGGFRGRLVLDRLDSASFPNRGYIASTRLFLSRRGLGSDDSYERFDFKGSAFWPRGRKIWLLSGLAAGSLGSDLPEYDQFTVGGFYSLSGLERGQLRGQYAGVLRGGLLYRLTSQPSLLAKGVYLGAYAEAGNAWDRSIEIGEDLIYAGTVLFGIDSFLGPLYIAYGVADTGQDELYVSLGRAF